MAATTEVALSALKEEISNLLSTSQFEDANEITTTLSVLSAKNNEFKSITDQAFREHLLRLVSVQDVELLKKYISYNIAACRLELCTSSSPVILLGDIFDMSTLEFCENLFSFVEVNVNVWKDDLFFGPCKNNLLRMCNDLLRRLSRSQNTVFCGRILLFLAQFFPFSERSGLNIISEFNIENITDFNTDGDIDSLVDEDMDEDIAGDSKIKVDFSLYSKFWYLQNFFRCPNDLYGQQKWLTFCNYTKQILATLQDYKLDGVTEKAYISNLTTDSDSDYRYFAKFLTNQKLLELQLSDTNFRRYVLVQFLILFQYLTSTVKSKPESCKLKPEQIKWIEMTTETIYTLVRETPPDGNEFLESVKKILVREERWNNWKNESCPEVKKPNPLPLDFRNVQRPKEKFVGDLLKNAWTQKKYYMGNPRMTKLWNHKPDNLGACRSKERQFLPSLEGYFQTAIEQSDPAAMIEPAFKKVNDIDFAWRGLRLLSQKCPYFFAQSNNPIHKMSDFLENMLNKITKDKPAVLSESQEEKSKSDITAEVESQDVIINTDGAEEGDVNYEANGQDDAMEEDKNQRTPFTKDMIDRVAETVTSNWQKLALKMDYKEDEIEYFAKEKSTDTEIASYLLQIWSEDDDDPSVEKLLFLLDGLNLDESMTLLKSFIK